MEMNENIHKKKKIDPRVVLGVGLVIIGALILFNNMCFIDFNVSRVIFSFPAIMTIIGILILTHGSNKIFGSILLALGVFFLIPKIFPWVYYGNNITFPDLIIAFGIYIIIRRRSIQSGSDSFTTEGGFKKYDTDRIDDISIFGGGQKIIASKNFKGGNVTSIFGGSEIDFTNCTLSEKDSIIDILAIFGGSTLIVPSNWNVIVDVFTLFGGFSNKVRRAPDTKIDMDKTLIIKGLVIFGGGEVKSF